jgi:hypothetical protein
MKRKLVGFDIETFFIVNQVAPQPVCVSLYVDGKRELYKASEGAARLKQLLTDERVDLVAHNANFDLISLSVFDLQLFKMFFNAMKQGRVYCSKLAEILLNTADPACEGHARVNVFIDRGEDYERGRWLPVSSNALVGCAYKYLGVDLSGDKDSDLRLSYGELVDVPLDQWSQAAKDYAEGDAQYTHDVLVAQYERGAQLAERIGVNPLDDLARQTCAEYVLQLSSTVLGVQVDVDRIDEAVEGLMTAHDEGIETAVLYGLYKPTKNERGYSAVNAQVQTLLQRAVDIVGIDHPTTSAGKLTTNKTAMSTLYDAIDYALSYKRNLDHKAPLSPLDVAELAGIQAAFKSREASETAWKAKRTFLDALRGAALNPDSRLRYKYNGLMETGRTSSSSPNLQNIPRKGAARSCIKPRAGHIFIIADYSNAELRTLAQAHLNEGRASRLATEYQRNPHFDPHLFMAVRILGGMTYDEGLAVLSDKAHPQYKTLKEKRQLSKIANFGYAGGLGAEQFIDYAKGYGTRLTVDEATVLRDQWLETWVEMGDYFEQRGAMLREAEEHDLLERVEALTSTGKARRSKYVNDRDWSCVYHFKSSNRVRYLRKFTIACNTPFQGIASDGAKDALIDVFSECFFDRTSPLFKCKPVLFVHDEIVLEVPFDGSAQAHSNASAAAFRLRDLMVDGMQRHTPDVPAVAEPCLSYEWTKDAESDVLDNGLLSIYSSKE